MPIAEPELTLDIHETPWDVLITVNIRQAGTTRRAGFREAECKILDIGEVPADRYVYNETHWARTNENGQMLFHYSEFPWLGGYDGLAGANRISVWVRLTDRPEVETSKDVRLGTTTWTNPTSGGIFDKPALW